MTLPPITLFCLAAAIGALGGLWSVASRDDRQTWRDHLVGMLGGGLIGLATSLGLYERVGQTEFGECTLLALSLVFSMAGRQGFQRLFDGLARLYLGNPDQRSQSGPWRDVDQRRRPEPPRWGAPKREPEPERECKDDQQDSGPEMSTWP